MIEHTEHTLSDFIVLSLDYPIFPEGLPEGMDVLRAAEQFAKWRTLKLRPLHFKARYFIGWLDAAGRKVETVSGEHLFTVIGADLRRIGGYRLIIQPAALKYLEDPPPEK